VAIYARRIARLNVFAKKNVRKYVHIKNAIIIAMKLVKNVKKNILLHVVIQPL
jgi:hypothetical protein